MPPVRLGFEDEEKTMLLVRKNDEWGRMRKEDGGSRLKGVLGWFLRIADGD